jgi:hypothetical protein
MKIQYSKFPGCWAFNCPTETSIRKIIKGLSMVVKIAGNVKSIAEGGVKFYKIYFSCAALAMPC